MPQNIRIDELTVDRDKIVVRVGKFVEEFNIVADLDTLREELDHEPISEQDEAASANTLASQVVRRLIKNKEDTSQITRGDINSVKNKTWKLDREQVIS